MYGNFSGPKMYLAKLVPDMKFVGIFYIIIGALYCLTIIGAIIGVPLIIMGVRLRESSEGFSMYASSDQENFLMIAYEKLSNFFKIMKILIIIGLVLMALYIIFIFAFFNALSSSVHYNL